MNALPDLPPKGCGFSGIAYEHYIMGVTGWCDWPPPYEYQGRPTAWQKLSREFGDPIPHFHHCPECYESKRCLYPCTLEPDLEEEHGPYGSHMSCRQCAPWKFDEDIPPPPKVPEEQLRLFEIPDPTQTPNPIVRGRGILMV